MTYWYQIPGTINEQ